MKARFATFFFLGVLVMLPFLLGANEKSCALVCTNGQTQCSGNEVQTCQNSAWVNTTDCSASGDTCQNGQCVVGCQTAANCTGPLPQVCQVCTDGSDGCAHWACVAGKCEITYCTCEPTPCPQDEVWDSAQCKCGPICSNGTIGTGMCCLSAGDFPNTCPVTPCVCPAGEVCNCPAIIEACGCSSDSSHEVKVCTCPNKHVLRRH